MCVVVGCARSEDTYLLGMEMEDAIRYTDMYLNGDYEDEFEPGFHTWGGGDTMDRNYVLDLYLEANDLTPTDVFN